MDNDDLRWVVDAIDIQYEVGGNLAEVLDTVAETIRDRSQVQRQVRALSAEGRMSAVILIGLPFGLAGMIAVVSPDYLADLTGTTLGRIMMGVALVLIGIGAVWIRRIVRVVF
jgi:tight adherence protein B